MVEAEPALLEVRASRRWRRCDTHWRRLTPCVAQIFERSGRYRLRLAVSVDGHEYEAGDFRLRLGRAVATGSAGALGVLLEAEYLPVACPQLGSAALGEVLHAVARATRAVPGNWEALPEPPFADFGLPPGHGHRHAALMLHDGVEACRRATVDKG